MQFPVASDQKSTLRVGFPSPEQLTPRPTNLALLIEILQISISSASPATTKDR
jgi:hypothetical protein